MKSFKISILAAIVGLFSLSSCNDDTEGNDTPSNQTGTFQIKMDYVWGMGAEPFMMNQDMVHPRSGDTLSFTTFKHYISNVKLHKADGSVWEEENSYHLVDASSAESSTLAFSNVPSGEYTSIEVTFGVDSTRNVSGSQTGALDPANEMFWSWNSGYIMIKAEGTSPQADMGSFAYHIGGFMGENNTVMTRVLNFPEGVNLSVTPNANPAIHVLANPARLFHTYGSVSQGAKIHMPGPATTQMAEDFNTWARVDHIHP